jgi:hypothetical protein
VSAGLSIRKENNRGKDVKLEICGVGGLTREINDQKVSVHLKFLGRDGG